ncbi:MAG: hypothetical protein QG659_506 [Patescibacteria group bacterium]|jgi:lycopene cyclase domain-containing protein|nr:hypothetical protein [Patescibacteria group bacterium]
MATYLILNTVFLVFTLVVVLLSSWQPNRAWLLGLVVLLVLTLVFDSLIIYFKIVGYDVDMIAGFYFGKAPVEDLFYAVVASLLVPVLWHSLKSYNDTEKEA